MRIRIFLAFLVFSFQVLKAQIPGGAPQANRPAPPSIGRIYGKLVDSSGKSIGSASVMVLHQVYDSATKKSREVLLKGVSSQANGDFNLEDLPLFKPLKLKISATGHKPLEQTVSIQPKPAEGGAPRPANGGGMPNFSAMAGAYEKDLGKLEMKPDVVQLQDVVVTSSTGRLRMDIDKKVFNVDRNIVSAGGTAVDVMKNVPSLNVDIDGNVTLRNASPQLLVDGRPTTLSLDQIPADAIESVEVITNPSAKYDASGGNAGILNIVLKKNKKSGYNGNVNAGIDKRGGLNGGGSFSFRQNKVNVSLSSFGNQMKNRTTGSTDIRNLLTSPNLLVNQDSRTRMNGGFLFGRVGVDYFATNRTTFSLGAIRVTGSFDPTERMKTDSLQEGGDYISYSERTARNRRVFNARGLQGGFKHLFPKQGEELTGDANYFSGNMTSNSLYQTSIFARQGGAKKDDIQQQILGSGAIQFLTVQTDYVKPLGDAAKLEAGARAQLRNLSNIQANYFMDPGTGQFKLLPSTSTNYQNKDNVYAAYVSYKRSIKDFGYQVGLRGESSDYVGKLTETKEKFSNRYPISLFPSLFLSQKLKDKQEVQLSYTRRVNRPFFLQVIPFIDSTNQLSWTRGNAGLRPEFTNSLEASYSKTFKGNNTFLASVYYKYSTDLITRFLDTITIGSNEKRPISTFINANSSRSAGVEFTAQNTVTKWWDMNTNLNIYNSKINTGNNGRIPDEALWSWFAKMNSNFKLPKRFKLQLSGTYQSRTNLPVNQGGSGFGGPGGGGPPMGGSPSAAQGYIKSNYGIDAALQKAFLKNDAASITFNVSDIFRTRRFDQFSQSPFFIQNSHRLNDVPMFRLNFSFRFGQMDMSLFKRKNTRGEMEGAGAIQGMAQ